MSANEYAKVKGYINEVKANPGRYSAPSDGSVEGTRNCIDFAEGALKAAGKAETTQDLFEKGQLSGMAGSEINRRREQQNNKGN
ncbi:MAG TPA: hypothetical protein VLL76_12285, partial [Candidatus Omnitrophota bacterium]|nr:hypothetical protein [Candidatus Omnitrophota bacterium]